jgi:hypothetical protein
MDATTFYESLPFPGVLADLILLVHVGLVAFVVLGQLLFIVGGVRDWQWVRNIWVRGIHLVTIGIVVIQAWLGRLCPLTLWEHGLRRAAGQRPHEQGLLESWVGNLLFYDLPWWVFVMAYTGFAVLVAWSWWWLPPRRPSGVNQASSSPKDSVR